MLTKTSETAVKALLHLVLHGGSDPLSPRQIAADIGTSPTYLAKTTALLVKAGILRSHRGAQGGVTLAQPAQAISLLQIVEACQGRILASYCQPFDKLNLVCGYHEAMHEIHAATTGILGRWTLADLTERPGPHKSIAGRVHCRMAGAGNGGGKFEVG